MFLHRAERVAARPATACGPHSAALLKHTFPPVLLHYLADLLITPLVLVRLFYSQAGISISTPRMAVTWFCPSNFYCGRKSRGFCFCFYFLSYSISFLKEKKNPQIQKMLLWVSAVSHVLETQLVQRMSDCKAFLLLGFPLGTCWHRESSRSATIHFQVIMPVEF